MKRFVAILLTALMMLSLLTACTAEQPPTGEPAVPKTAEEAASSEPAAESAEPETVTLHLFHQKQEWLLRLMKHCLRPLRLSVLRDLLFGIQGVIGLYLGRQ